MVSLSATIAANVSLSATARDIVGHPQIGELDDVERAVALPHQQQHQGERAIRRPPHRHHQRLRAIVLEQPAIEGIQPGRVLERRRGRGLEQRRVLLRQEIEGLFDRNFEQGKTPIGERSEVKLVGDHVVIGNTQMVNWFTAAQLWKVANRRALRLISQTRPIRSKAFDFRPFAGDFGAPVIRVTNFGTMFCIKLKSSFR